MIVNYEIFLRLVAAVVAGGIVGFEREIFHKSAGIRTQMLVSLGAALFTISGLHILNADPVRIASGVVTGIGFLGAGTIFRHKDKVKGLTTAASMWATAALGIGFGLGEYLLAGFATVLVIVILQLNKIKYIRQL